MDGDQGPASRKMTVAAQSRPETEGLMSSDCLRPDRTKSALIIVDVQNDFALQPGKSHIIPRIRLLAEKFRECGRPVIHIVRIYLPDGSNVDLCRRENIRQGKRIVIADSEGAQIIPDLLPSADIRLATQSLLKGEAQRIGPAEWIIYKPRWGAFYQTSLEGHLRALGVDSLVICGCNFPNCPRATIYEAGERDFRIIAVTDGISNSYEQGFRELAAIGVVLMSAGEAAAWVAGETS